MRTRTIIASLFMMVWSVNAQAVIINTTAHGTWDVSTKVGTFDELTAELKAQPWWDSVPLAEEFAGLVADAFDYPNPGPISGFGPLFALAPSPNDLRFGIYHAIACNDLFYHCGYAGAYVGERRTFALASRVPVPEPGPLALLGLGLAGMGFARRQRKHACK